MEDVFQTYLRNQFKTIEEYNEYAGEVAEPYHVLVVANFPTNFSDSAVRRLVSIASSGARCGVYTLVSVDSRQALPHNFDLADLRQHANCLAWTGDRFAWQDQDLGWLPLRLETPPEPADFVDNQTAEESVQAPQECEDDGFKLYTVLCFVAIQQIIIPTERHAR